MSPLAGEGCWALVGLPRFLEGQASLLRKHSFSTTLISWNNPISSTPATMSTNAHQSSSLFSVVNFGNHR